MQTCVYILTFTDGKKYVGQTRRGFPCRFEEHAYDAARGVKRPLYEAWRSQGDPSTEEAGCSVEELDELECFLIEEANSRLPNGYNAIPGGGALPQLDPAVAAKIAQTHRTAPHLLAKIRKAQSLRWKGATAEERAEFMERIRPRGPRSAETRAKISAARKGKLKGIPKSHEHAAKVGAANRGKKRSPEQIERIRQGAIRGWANRLNEMRI